jgi:hypothetical protein
MKEDTPLAAAWRLVAVGAACALVSVVGASPASSEVGARQRTQLMKLAVPADGAVYLGMYVRGSRTDRDCSTSSQCLELWGDTRPFSERVQDVITNELGGKKLAFMRVYAGWEWFDGSAQHPNAFSEWAGDIDEVQRFTGPNSAVFLDWSITATNDNGGVTVKDIAAGKQDAYIEAYAHDVKSYGKPLLIRLFGGELNGSWWWGQSPLANPSLTTTDFVNAWRRVVDIFRRVGALNVSWAWNVNAMPPTPVPWIDSNIAAYWPGDDYVDWAGADIYDGSPPSELDVPYDFAVAHGKPFFLAEWAVRHDRTGMTPSRQNAWLNAIFDYVESHPAIKAISYFNHNSRHAFGFPVDPAKLVCLSDGKVCYQRDTNDDDHRLLADSGAGWRQTFSRRVASPRYLSNTRSEPVGPAVVPPAVTRLTVAVKGLKAVVRWRGNSEASFYDVGLRRPPAGWATVVQSSERTSYTIRGKKGQRYEVRVRALDAMSVAGPWSRPLAFRLR